MKNIIFIGFMGSGKTTIEKIISDKKNLRFIDMDLEITNADLFICEGMYGEEGKEKKAREYKHMTFYEAAHLAKEADVKQMWLTHYSPSLVRAEEFMGKVKSIFPRAKAGKDGKTITLDFQEE